MEDELILKGFHVDGFFVKPVNIDALKITIRDISGKKGFAGGVYGDSFSLCDSGHKH